MNECQPTEQQETQVSDQLSGLTHSLNRTQDRLNDLEERLSPVLKEIVPSPIGKENAKDSETLVPLAGEIKNKHKQVSALEEMLLAILDRLEL